MKDNHSAEHIGFLRKLRAKRRMVSLLRGLILVGFFLLWEGAAYFGWIDAFIFSSPSRAVSSLWRMISEGSLWNHVGTTLLETLIGFFLGTLIGFVAAILLWFFPTAEKVLDPYLVILNSLPKIALGPVIIVWVGSGMSSIITVTLLISVVSTTMGMLTGFQEVDGEKLTLMKSFGANRLQTLTMCVFPASTLSLISVLKINVGMVWVGVIVGEFLVSRAGLGYLIVYGGQVFRMDLVMGSVLILCVLAALMYYMVAGMESLLKRRLAE